MNIHINNVHENYKVTESFCDEYCNGGMGMHICWSSEDFEDWIGFDMEDVGENLKTNQTLYKCLHCDFRV